MTRPDKTVIKSGRDGVSEMFDGDGKLTGRGLFNLEFTVEFGGDGENREYKVDSRGRPEFEFTLTESGAGDFQLRESGSETSMGFVNDGDFKLVEEERKILLANIESGIVHPIMKAKFHADMIRFENRARDRKLPADAVLDSYKAINKLFAADGNPPIDARSRKQIPIIVNARMAPFWIPSNQNSSLGSQGAHMVNITDAHRTKLMEKIRVDDARRRKEAREFVRATAE